MDDDITRELVSDALTELAPEETILVDSYDPDSANNGVTARGPQGFGVETAVALMLPYLWKFFDKYVERLASDAADETIKLTVAWLKTDDASPSPKIKDDVRKELLAVGLPQAKVESAIPAVLVTLRKYVEQLISH